MSHKHQTDTNTNTGTSTNTGTNTDDGRSGRLQGRLGRRIRRIRRRRSNVATTLLGLALSVLALVVVLSVLSTAIAALLDVFVVLAAAYGTLHAAVWIGRRALVSSEWSNATLEFGQFEVKTLVLTRRVGPLCMRTVATNAWHVRNQTVDPEYRHTDRYFGGVPGVRWFSADRHARSERQQVLRTTATVRRRIARPNIAEQSTWNDARVEDGMRGALRDWKEGSSDSDANVNTNANADESSAEQ